MVFDDKYISLIKEVRKHRSQMQICPSAQDGVDVPAIILEFCNNAFFKEDYQAITSYFSADYVSYEDTIQTMETLAQSNLFL